MIRFKASSILFGKIRKKRYDHHSLWTNLKDAASAQVAVNQLSGLRAPNVDTLVKTAAGKIFAVRTKVGQHIAIY